MDEGGYGRFAALSRQELERYCYLDDKDWALIAARRRDYNRLGFAVQVVAVRNLGMFLADPVDVPAELVQYLAEQLGIDDPSCVKQYTERRDDPVRASDRNPAGVRHLAVRRGQGRVPGVVEGRGESSAAVGGRAGRRDRRGGFEHGAAPSSDGAGDLRVGGQGVGAATVGAP